MMKHMTWKKAASLLLSFIMILALVPMASAVSPSDFTDFPTGWSKEAVTAAVANGLLNGRSADKIEPQGKLTRAEMATIINRAFGATVEADVSTFTDLSPDAWYYREIAKAVNMGTFQGDGNNTMRPDASITREEVFAVIARALVLESDDFSSLTKFKDADTVSDWAKPYASILVAKEYVNGDDLGNLNPRSDITREEFAQIMHNIIKTYYVTSGKHDTVGADSALIRTGSVTLRDVTIEGDLILGDGVGKGNVTLENVIIKGRLLARGGEGKVRLINTTVGESVVVKDVNGIVNFYNYRGEKPFTNLIEITKATFLSTSSGGGSTGGGGGGDTTKYVTYTVTHYAEDPTGNETVNGVTYKVVETETLKAKEGSDVTVPDAISIPGYTLDTTIGYGDQVGTEIPVSKDLEINLYYNLNRYMISVALPDGSIQELEYKHGEKFSDHFNVAAYPNSKFYYIPEGETEPVELKADTPITGAFVITSTTSFIVEFHSNDGSDEAYPINAFYGAILSEIAPSLNRAGYRLDSWNTKADGTGTSYAADAVMTEPVTIYAQWKVVPYSITYHSDVAFKTDAEIPYLYDTEKAVALPSAETFEEYPGYHFGGWYKDAEYTNKVDTIEIGSVGDVELYARWLKDEIIYRNVTFNLNYTGAPSATAVPVENGKTVAKPIDPERKGYTFAGWHKDIAGRTPYDFSAAVTADITLYAKWTVNSYPITYELNGGSWIAGTTPTTQYNVESLPVTLPETVTYTGKTFGGWFKDAALTVRVTTIPTGTTGEFKVYAKWTDNIYTVTVKTPGETDKTYHFVHGQTLKEVITKTPTRIGYTFQGYNTREDGTGTAYGENDAITANTVLYTRWTVNHYAVDYELNGGVKKNASAFVDSYTVNDAFNLPVAADFEARVGYTFQGWYAKEDFSSEAVTAIPAGTTGNKKFYAKWEAISYTVTYELNGGVKKNEAAFVATYTVANAVTLPTASDFEAMTGYTFRGWYASENFAGTAITSIPAGTVGNKTYYAKWEKNTYTVTFNVDGTESTVSYTHGDTIGSKMPDPVKEGYTFLYWSDSTGSTGNQYTASSAIDASVTLYAKWSTNEYTVTYVLGDGYEFANGFTPVTTFTVETNTFDLPTMANIKPSDTHDFYGWYTDAEMTQSISKVEKGTAKDITVYAKWVERIIIYNDVIFSYNYENAPQNGVYSKVPVAENTTVSAPAAAPERKGYTFAGWFSDAEGTTAYDFSAPVTAEITLYAKWSIDTFAIGYELNGGTMVNADKFPAEYNVETEVILPTEADIAKTGYKFVGWYETESFTSAAVTSIPAGTINGKTFYAKWDIVDYSISYETGSAVIKNPAAFEENYNVTEDITLPTASDFEEIPGYVFGGWFANDAFTGEAVTTIPAGTVGNKTYYAKWDKVSYTITYELNGGVKKNEAAFIASYSITDAVTLPTASDFEEMKGYTFCGWYDNQALSGSPVAQIPAGSVGAKTYYAKWEKDSYTITYKTNDGEIANDAAFIASYTVTDAITLPVASDFKARDGYSFLGWYEAEDFSGEAVTAIPAGTTGNKTFYAKWEKLSYTIAYELNGGVMKNEAAFTASYSVTDVVMLPTASDMEVISGYAFGGWYETAELTGNAVTAILAGTTGNKTYYAKWDKVSYTITYALNGGETENDAAFAETYTITDAITLPVASDFKARDGYNFLGWYETENFTGETVTSIPAGTIGNKIYYAKWEKLSYTIAYELNGGVKKNEAAFIGSYTVTDVIVLPTASDFEARDGYNFLGWYETEDFSGNAVTTILAGTVGGKTYYAKWGKEAYGISYVLNDGEIANDAAFVSEYTVTDEITLPTVSDFKARDGYNFLGWYEAADFSGNAVTTIPAGTVGSKTFYAKWEKVSYTIAYELNGGVKKNETAFIGSYTVTDAIVLPTASDFEARDGYNFLGWYEAADFSGNAVTAIPAGTVGAKTYYAKWGKDTYAIGYVLNGGEIANEAAFVSEYTVTDEIILPSASDFKARDGYNFLGWYEAADFSGNAVISIPAGTVGSKTFYAKWSKDAYGIHYVLNGGVKKNEAAFVSEYTVTDAITLPTASDFETLAGYTFGGWYEAEGFTGEAVTAIPAGSVGNKTFYAKWNKLTYSIVYELNGGAMKNEAAFVSEYTVTDEIILPTAADLEEKAGYIFSGWYEAEDFTGEAVTAIPAGTVGNKTYYAKWDKVSYTITYESNGGVKKNEVAFIGFYTITDEIALPTASDFEAMTGYTFGGWYEAEDLSGEGITSVPAGSTGNKTYYAKWNKLTYSIVYELNGGAMKNEAAFIGSYTVTDEIVLPTAADLEERAGYHFLGWYETEDFTSEAVTKIPAGTTGAKRLYAKWSADAYAITYELNGGVMKNEAAFVSEYTTSDEITLPIASDFETMTGYTFGGWYEAEDFTGEAVTIIPAGSIGNKTFYAKWNTNVYTVTFNVDGTTENKEYVHGATIDSQMEEPTKDGYFFIGWNTAADGSGTSYAHTAAVTQAVTLYAQWQEITAETYTVTFYDGVVDDEYMIINTSDVVQGAKMTQEQIDTALDGFTPYSYDGYKDGSYTHKIFPELWYIDADGEWQIFNDTVPVTSDMKVYYAFKNLSLFFDLKFGDLEMAQPVQFSVPYETDTRIMDSIKDALTLGRNQIDLALNVDDVYMDAIAKGATTFGDAIDANGNIKYINVDAALSDIIEANEVDGEIREYIEMLIVDNTDAAKIDSIFTHAIGSSLVDDTILEGGAYDHNKIEAYINTLTVEERIKLADDLHSILSQETFYREFIDAYAQEHANFHVTHESVDLIMAVATAVNDYTYDELKDRIYNKFGSVIDLLGDEAAEDFLRDAQDRYYAGALVVWEDVHAHENQESYESTYPAYLTFKVNIIDHLFRPVYGKGITKLVGKLQGNTIYRYNENPYLRQFVTELDADTLVSDLLYIVPKTEDNIGYALWPSTAGESGFLHYYDYMLEKLILFDKAMLWYEENLTAEEMEVLKNKIFEDAATFINKANELIAAYEADGSLPMGMNINDLTKYEAFNKIFSKVEGKLTQVIDKYKSTPFYGKVWDANSLRNDISYSNEAVDVLLGLDNPTFNVDSLMNKDSIFNKLGFTDYTYGDDEALGTVTVQAIQRIFKESTIKARRYYQ